MADLTVPNKGGMGETKAPKSSQMAAFPAQRLQNGDWSGSMDFHRNRFGKFVRKTTGTAISGVSSHRETFGIRAMREAFLRSERQHPSGRLVFSRFFALNI